MQKPIKFIVPLLLLSCFFAGIVSAQKKGVTPVSKKEEKKLEKPEFSTTRALVVGISNYADEDIPDLKYAHVDAEKMVDFLESGGGGRLLEENIKFLSDEKATVAQIYSELDWLLEVSLPDDKVIIYFSGHGDVETQTRRQQGFFLAHDTPPTNYRIGALRIEDLNDYLETMALENRSKVMIITDACRSGHLAGGNAGAKTTAENMSEILANEIKIMSCKPDELSLEGEQWGGGRGVFSYHLLDGLGGLADIDGNGHIELSEIDNYLKERVVLETDSSQVPGATGAPETLLFDVDEETLDKILESKKTAYLSGFVADKGNIAAFLNKIDTANRRLYEEFLAAIDAAYLLPVDMDTTRQAGKSADELYRILIKKAEMKPLFFTMKQRFVVALQDDVQRALNAYLAADPKELIERWENYGAGYKKYPAYLTRAAELLGESHVLYSQLLAKKFYFESVILRLDGEKDKIDSLFFEALEKGKAALQLDTNAAYIYNELGLIYDRFRLIELGSGNSGKIAKLDSLQISMYREAMDIAPKWAMPYNNLGTSLMHLDSLEVSEKLLLKAIEYKPDLPSAYFNLGLISMEKGDEEIENEMYKKALSFWPNFPEALWNLGENYFYIDDYTTAENLLSRSVANDSTNFSPLYYLGMIRFISGELEESKFLLLKALQIEPNDNETLYNLACIASLNKSVVESAGYLERAILSGFQDLESMDNDKDLENLRKDKLYKEIISKYFPD